MSFVADDRRKNKNYMRENYKTIHNAPRPILISIRTCIYIRILFSSDAFLSIETELLKEKRKITFKQKKKKCSIHTRLLLVYALKIQNEQRHGLLDASASEIIFIRSFLFADYMFTSNK